MADDRDVRVVDEPAGGRFEVTVEGQVAGITAYRREGDTVEMPHTEIDEAFGGQGLGSILVKGALDSFRSQGLAVIPECPFVRAYIQRHAEYLDLVPGDRRPEFGLPAD